MPKRHWMPGATKRKMPYNGRLPKRDQQPMVILHTNGGGTDHGSLYGWFSRPGNDICSHFQVAKDGTIEQYVGIDRQAYAQFSGNAYGVSIETEDDGKPSTPWTKAQLDSIVKIADWLGVPAKLAPDGPGGGVGWHEQYHDWNQSGHDCPGTVREKQIRTKILPALKAAQAPAHHSKPKHASKPHKAKPKRLRWGPFRSRSIPNITRELNAGQRPSAKATADLQRLAKAVKEHVK